MLYYVTYNVKLDNYMVIPFVVIKNVWYDDDAKEKWKYQSAPDLQIFMIW